jgi:hypothetical protein
MSIPKHTIMEIRGNPSLLAITLHANYIELCPRGHLRQVAAAELNSFSLFLIDFIDVCIYAYMFHNTTLMHINMQISFIFIYYVRFYWLF